MGSKLAADDTSANKQWQRNKDAETQQQQQVTGNHSSDSTTISEGNSSGQSLAMDSIGDTTGSPMIKNEDRRYKEEDNEKVTIVSSPDGSKMQQPHHAKRANRGRPSSCVFVASLSAMHSDDHLCNSVNDHFKQWGEITLVKVLRDQVNRPYAFVQYTNDKDAADALTGAQHNTLDGRTIRCEPARVNRTLFITPLKDSYANEPLVQDFLNQYGEVEELIYSNSSPSSNRKHHNWFAKFAYRDDAIRAYASLRLDNDWSAEWAQNLNGPYDNRGTIDKQSIFIGQLNSNVTKEKLIERFSRHGKVLDCNLIIRYPDATKIISDDGNRNYSFAFIKFDQEQAAAEAVEQENHTVFMDKTIHVQYRELYHNQNPKQQNQHHHHNNNNNHTNSNNHMPSFEPKLALAPPPINLPSKYPVGGTQRVPVRHHSYPVTPIPNHSNPNNGYIKRFSWGESPQRPQKWKSSSGTNRGYYYPSPQQPPNNNGRYNGVNQRNSPSDSSSTGSQRMFSNSEDTNTTDGNNSRKTSYESQASTASNTYTPPNKRIGSNEYTQPLDKQKQLEEDESFRNQQKEKKSTTIVVSSSIKNDETCDEVDPQKEEKVEKSKKEVGVQFNTDSKAKKSNNHQKSKKSPAYQGNSSQPVQLRADHQAFVPRGMVMMPNDTQHQPQKYQGPSSPSVSQQQQPFAYYPMEGYYPMSIIGTPSYPYPFPGMQFPPMYPGNGSTSPNASEGMMGWPQAGGYIPPYYYGYYNPGAFPIGNIPSSSSPPPPPLLPPHEMEGRLRNGEDFCETGNNYENEEKQE